MKTSIEPSSIYACFNTHKDVHIIAEQEVQSSKLAQRIATFGFHSETFSSLEAYQKVLDCQQQHKPSVLFYILRNCCKSSLDELENFTNLDSLVPLIVCCTCSDLDVQLKALRAGAQCFIKLPVSDNQLQETLTDLSITRPKEPFRVLLIDDETITLDMHAHTLTEAGLEVHTLSDPLNTLNVVRETRPEVIVLDVNMPGASGFELAAILRNNEEYRYIPILFLSSESDILTELQALSLGGHDYYIKPVEPRRFINGVTARAKYSRSSNTARERLRQIVYERDREHIALNNHALVSVTDVEGLIITANQKFSQVSGYSNAELLGSNHRILKSGVHEDSFYAKVWDTISSGKSWHGEICNKAKDGSLYWVDSTICPLLNEDGKPYQYVAIRTDITPLKKAETNLINARDQAEKANRAKSEFLANMSHELRTPLNAIVGFSQLLDTSEELSVENHDDVAEILKASKHLLSLINDVLDLSKIEAGKLEVSLENIMLMPLIQECVTMIMPMALKRNILLDCEGHQELCIRCDRGRFKQVILNLLSNAIKYNVENGSVKISFDCVKTGYLQIRIKDSGIGIAEDSINTIFKPFSRLEYQYSEIEGTGIGLALTRQLVEQMGGFVGVESQLNCGSTFWVELPTSMDSAAPNSPDSNPKEWETAANNNCSTHLKLIYIDDNATNLKLMDNIVGQMPEFDLSTYQDPFEGIKCIMQSRPRLVLLDIHMPLMSGYEVLRTLKANKYCKDIPVIAVSANALLRDVEEGLIEGFQEYVTKPFDIKHLQHLIRKHTLPKELEHLA